MRYVAKKIEEIEAEQFTDAMAANPKRWPKGTERRVVTDEGRPQVKFTAVHLGVRFYFEPGDWLVRSGRGFYAIDAETFKATFEPPAVMLEPRSKKEQKGKKN